MPTASLSGRTGLEGKGEKVPHWEYLRWMAYVGAALGAWRYLPLTIIRLVAAFTHNERRHKQCMEVLRLARRDASSIPSYLPESNALASGGDPTLSHP